MLISPPTTSLHNYPDLSNLLKYWDNMILHRNLKLSMKVSHCRKPMNNDRHHIHHQYQLHIYKNANSKYKSLEVITYKLVDLWKIVEASWSLALIVKRDRMGLLTYRTQMGQLNYPYNLQMRINTFSKGMNNSTQDIEFGRHCKNTDDKCKVQFKCF